MVAAAHQANERSRIRTREYGYLNYGDWFGERGRNWGNKWHATSPSFFMQFARTGTATTTARPRSQRGIRPMSIACMPIGSLLRGATTSTPSATPALGRRIPAGHLEPPVRLSHEAANGHTWADGTVTPALAGDARVMEAARAGRTHRLGRGAGVQGPGHARALGRLVDQGCPGALPGHGRPEIPGAARHIGSVSCASRSSRRRRLAAHPAARPRRRS